MLLTLLVVVFVGDLVLFGALLIFGSGRTATIMGENRNLLPDSLAEKIHVTINGVRQGMIIESKDAGNPVLLFLHGGPGMPEYFLTQRYPTGLENLFTVVWWDQRGAGLSYSPGIAPETMTAEQIVADTLAVTNYLRKRFGKAKIYLMAHSGGTFFGIQAVAQAPELFHAYIGVAQISYQLKSEILAHEYMLQTFRVKGNAGMVRKLESAAPTLTAPLPPAYDRLRDGAMHGLGIGTTRTMKSVVTGVFLPSLQCRAYTVREKIDLWRGKAFSMRWLRDTVFATDLTHLVRSVDVPVYYFSGIHDYTVNCALAKDYLAMLEAPLKGFYSFEQSAHSPMFEEPEKTRRIMRADVLTGGNSLADAP